MGLVIDISKYASSPYVKQLRQADCANDKSEKACNNQIDTDQELIAAAKLISNGTVNDAKQAEDILRKALNITDVAAPAGGSAKGAEIKSASPQWGKSGIKAKVDAGTLTISGSLADSEQYGVTIEPLDIKAGQKLVFEVEVKGAFIWGGKNITLIGMPDPTVVGGTLVKADNPWIVIESPGKATIKVPYKDADSVSGLTIKTGGMQNGSIVIKSIRVE